MPLIAIPNISTAGGDPLRAAVDAVTRTGGRVLDIHADPVHNRSVLTCSAATEALEDSMVGLAGMCRQLDLTRHSGVHPRLGGLDVCPFVPLGTDMAEAIEVARRTASRIGDDLAIPVYLYGAAATRPETRELPDIRRGGLDRLIVRANRSELLPDAGPAEIDPRVGVVCVGARDVLIAFNVWLAGPIQDARAIAADIRRPGLVRALGLQIDGERVQVSTNLVGPGRVGIDEVFEIIAARAAELGMTVTATEIVGLVPERFLPRPDAKAARLLVESGRSLEAALAN